jgi:hypothetical protein
MIDDVSGPDYFDLGKSDKVIYYVLFNTLNKDIVIIHGGKYGGISLGVYRDPSGHFKWKDNSKIYLI